MHSAITVKCQSQAAQPVWCRVEEALLSYTALVHGALRWYSGLGGRCGSAPVGFPGHYTRCVAVIHGPSHQSKWQQRLELEQEQVQVRRHLVRRLP